MYISYSSTGSSANLSLFSATLPRENYEGQLAHFQQILDANFHLVANQNEAIGYNTATQILFAMIKNKPILMLDLPQFSPDIDLFAHELIERCLGKILVMNVHIFEPQELQMFLDSLGGPINYVLTRQDKALIQSRVRRHFYSLLT